MRKTYINQFKFDLDHYISIAKINSLKIKINILDSFYQANKKMIKEILLKTTKGYKKSIEISLYENLDNMIWTFILSEVRGTK